MNYDEIIKRLISLRNPENVKAMAKFGINPENVYGISVQELRAIARKTAKEHELAQKLWKSGIHEAQILASMIDMPKFVTEKQMDDWVNDFDSWDLCDQVCMNLFDKTAFVHNKIIEWTADKKEFVKRAGFVLIAVSAVHNKSWIDKDFERYFPLIKEHAIDKRNFVKKAVNWALRQIGKRNKNLYKKAIAAAKEIQKIDSSSARWIASNALQEFDKKSDKFR